MENKTDSTDSKNTLMSNLTIAKSSFLSSKLIIGLIIIVVVLGIGTGYIFGRKNFPGSVNTANSVDKSGEEGVVGSKDTKTFKDAAEGKLEVGGINGEGAYHLVRPGGKSQYVYLTSSVVDLSPYVGRKIKVWGETQKAQHAGWLMDVGRIDELE